MSTNLVKIFDYPDEQTRQFCEGALGTMRRLMRKTVLDLIEIGHLLEDVKLRLPFGRYEPWVEAHFGGSVSSAQRCRRLALFADRWPDIRKFESTEAALGFTGLDPDVQDKVRRMGAYTWKEYEAVVKKAMCDKWKEKIAEHLASPGKTEEEKVGDVVEWVKNDLQDPQVADAAREWWETNRERVGRLSDRHPAEVDAEIGYKPPRESGQAGYLDGEDGLWLARKGIDGNVEWIAPIEQVVRLWPGPRIAMATVRDGPAMAAFNAAVVEAALKCGLVARTPVIECIYGEPELL